MISFVETVLKRCKRCGGTGDVDGEPGVWRCENCEGSRCQDCDYTGTMREEVSEVCIKCDGEGFSKRLVVKIPTEFTNRVSEIAEEWADTGDRETALDEYGALLNDHELLEHFEALAEACHDPIELHYVVDTDTLKDAANG